MHTHLTAPCELPHHTHRGQPELFRCGCGQEWLVGDNSKRDHSLVYGDAPSLFTAETGGEGIS